MIAAHALAERAGITYRQLDHWTRVGLIDATGGGVRGVPREYDDDTLPLLRVMARLVDVGIEPRKAREFAEIVTAEGCVRVGEFLIVRVAA